MSASKSFKLIGISMLVVVWLAACGKQGVSETAENKSPAANPAGYLQHLVSTNAVVLGTKEGETTPSYQISFSNGYMESGAPGDDHPISSGQIFNGGSANATCIGFNYESLGSNAHDFLCVTIRDFKPSGVDLKKGDLFIQEQQEKSMFGNGFSSVFHAQVK